jgi:hypothetical protein
MKHSFIALILLAALLVLLAGCTTLPPAAVPTVPTPEPTQSLPPGKNVTIQVNQKDPIYATITVIFAGGEGQIAVTDILVRVTTPEGTMTTEHLRPVKGDEVVFQGSRETDRLEAWVTLNTGVTYKTVDTLVPFRTRA